MDVASIVDRVRGARPKRVVVIAKGRDPEELAHTPAWTRNLQKRLQAGDVSEVQGFDRQGILVVRVETDKPSPGGATSIPSPGPAAPAPPARVHHAGAGGGGGTLYTDPEAQRMAAFVEGQKVILGEFRQMLDPIFTGFAAVTESLTQRVTSLESQARDTVYVETGDDPEPAPAEPDNDLDQMAKQVMRGVMKQVGGGGEA